MQKTILITMLAVALMSGLISCDSSKNDSQPAASGGNTDSLKKRGQYLVTIAGCDDCHSPKKFGAQGPEIDMDNRFSGFPASRPFPKYDSTMIRKGLMMFNEDLTSAAGPWGVSFAANISSDATGLGNWTEARFFKALREGKFKGLDGSRGLLPPMPWQNIGKMTDDDLKAVFTFLKSTRPVKNIVPGTRQIAELK